MKLLVCDVEGTIFKPHMIKSAQHASYIWTAIAAALGKDAEREEILTQKKWALGGYGHRQDGQAYIDWVNDTIRIHMKYGLNKDIFDRLIDDAPYIDGVENFFAQLDRNKYIPILISGGIQNLNEKACRELGISLDNSYAACKYFFNKERLVDADLTFSNTCNFYGKQEIVKIALRKYGLKGTDLIFIGDGINDVSVAQWATKRGAISIGIDPVDELKRVSTFSYSSFEHLMEDNELMEQLGFFTMNPYSATESDENDFTLNDARARVAKQVGGLNLVDLEKRALKRLSHNCRYVNAAEARRFIGVEKLLELGELSIALISKELGDSSIVSALLQPFSNASEIMIFVCLALTYDKHDLKDLLRKDFTLYSYRKRIENPDLKKVMREYFRNRNISAHTSHEMSMDAAYTFIRRTYEIIQRLELIINP